MRAFHPNLYGNVNMLSYGIDGRLSNRAPNRSINYSAPTVQEPPFSNRIIIEPPHQVVEPPHQVVEPPHQVVEPPQQVMEPPQQVMEPPQQVMEPPQQVVEPPIENALTKIDPKNPAYPWVYPRFYKTILANARKLKDNRILLYTIDDFLNDQECEYIKSLIDREHRPSTIVGADREPDKYYRTSSTCDLCNLNDDYINSLEQRMGDYVGLDHRYAEGMQGQYYKYKQEFKTHTDYFEPGTDDYQKEAAVQGQRTWTFMLYLNDVEEGGETTFRNIGKTFYPKKGQGVIWMNSNVDGTPNPFTEHQGSPVIKGEKYIITKWFRERDSDDIPAKLMLHRQLPVWTSQGFFKTRMPYPLYEYLKEIYYRGGDRMKLEDRNGLENYIYHHTRAPDKDESITYVMELQDQEKEYVERSLQPQLESWVGLPLEMTSTYGIRIYTRGAVLKPHVDRYQTHIVSAILNIAQDVEKPWPLTIQDHQSREHVVYLEPGEIIFYESSRLIHGRPYPLEGERFANVFVHAKPIDWDQFTHKLDLDYQDGLLDPLM